MWATKVAPTQTYFDITRGFVPFRWSVGFEL